MITDNQILCSLLHNLRIISELLKDPNDFHGKHIKLYKKIVSIEEFIALICKRITPEIMNSQQKKLKKLENLIFEILIFVKSTIEKSTKKESAISKFLMQRMFHRLAAELSKYEIILPEVIEVIKLSIKKKNSNDNIPSDAAAVSFSNQIKQQVSQILNGLGGDATARKIIPALEKFVISAASSSVGVGSIVITGACAILTKQGYIRNNHHDFGVFTFMYPIKGTLPSVKVIHGNPTNAREATELTWGFIEKEVPTNYLTVISVSRDRTLPHAVGVECTLYLVGEFISLAFLSVSNLAKNTSKTLSRIIEKKNTAPTFSLPEFNVWTSELCGLNMSQFCIGQCVKTDARLIIKTKPWKGELAGYVCNGDFWAFEKYQPGLRRLQIKDHTSNTNCPHVFSSEMDPPIMRELFVL